MDKQRVSQIVQPRGLFQSSVAAALMMMIKVVRYPQFPVQQSGALLIFQYPQQHPPCQPTAAVAAAAVMIIVV